MIKYVRTNIHILSGARFICKKSLLNYCHVKGKMETTSLSFVFYPCFFVCKVSIDCAFFILFHGRASTSSLIFCLPLFYCFPPVKSCSKLRASFISTSRALLPSKGPMIPADSNWSIMRPARL